MATAGQGALGRLDFLNLSPQVVEGAVAIGDVRDVAAEGVAQHPPAVVLIHAVFLAEHGEGLAAVMGRVPCQADPFQGGVHPGAEISGAGLQQVPAAVMAPGHEGENGRVAFLSLLL